MSRGSRSESETFKRPLTQPICDYARVCSNVHWNTRQHRQPPCTRICGAIPVQFAESLVYSAPLRRVGYGVNTRTHADAEDEVWITHSLHYYIELLLLVHPKSDTRSTLSRGLTLFVQISREKVCSMANTRSCFKA